MGTLGFVLVALFVGLWVGANYARTKRARNDLRGTKKLVSGLRTKMWSSTFQTVRAALVLAGLLFAFYVGMRAAGKM